MSRVAILFEYGVTWSCRTKQDRSQAGKMSCPLDDGGDRGKSRMALSNRSTACFLCDAGVRFRGCAEVWQSASCRKSEVQHQQRSRAWLAARGLALAHCQSSGCRAWAGLASCGWLDDVSLRATTGHQALTSYRAARVDGTELMEFGVLRASSLVPRASCIRIPAMTCSAQERRGGLL